MQMVIDGRPLNWADRRPLANIRHGSDCIVSGDADLLALSPFRDISIVPPRRSSCKAWRVSHGTGRAGDYYGVIIGDVPHGASYSSYQADLIVRMPILRRVHRGQRHVHTRSG
jgi:hypothetical protein